MLKVRGAAGVWLEWGNRGWDCRGTVERVGANCLAREIEDDDGGMHSGGATRETVDC